MSDGSIIDQRARLLEVICANASVALFIMDERHHCILMNPAAERLTGFTLEEMQGRPLHDVVHHTRPDGSHYPIDECAIGRALPHNNRPVGEEVFVHKDGHFYDVAYCASPIREEGVLVGTVIEVQDITARKRAEQALRESEARYRALFEEQRVVQEALRRSNAELEQFAYVAAHDIQEPLRMIANYTQLLLRKLPADPSFATLGDRIVQAVSRTRTLLSDLLTYSRVVHGGEDEPAQTADLGEAVAAARQTLADAAAQCRATIVVERLPRVRGNAGQLSLVFQNLIGNALKYCRADVAPEIVITPRRDGDRWIVSVRDNGIGFDPQHAERVFGLFKRLHGDRYAGTGLGLAICRRIVERYGGRIWAESAGEGRGSTFLMALAAAD